MPIDMSKHKEAYLSEANAHINLMNLELLELEKQPQDTEHLLRIFRSAHTIKSLSGAMKYTEAQNLCHAIEDLLDKIRNEPQQVLDNSDLLFKAFDFLSADMEAIAKNEPELKADLFIEKISRLRAGETLSDLPKTLIEKDFSQKLQAIEVRVERLDNLMNLTEELFINKMRFDDLRDIIENDEFDSAVESLDRLIQDLQYYVMQIRLVPINFVFNRFLRMTRDLAKEEKKQITLKMEGGELELDRMLADELGESIAHLIRNAVDHGLETPEERKKKNKPAMGTIYLRASRTKDTAIIEVSDDGAGLDYQALKQVGVKNNIIDANATLKQIQDVIFSGLSTKRKVTKISGRGLGLAIVKQKIESIGGTLHVNSTAGKGTTFIIEIPLSLAIIKSLFVRVSGYTYAIPIDFVDRLVVVNQTDLKGMLDQQAIVYQDTEIPVIDLATLFGGRSSNLDAKHPIVIVKRDQHYLGLMVDSLASTEEVVVKPLTEAVRKNKFFSGAALVGSGEMVLILDIGYLLKVKKMIPDLS